jgi:hypothetical protein
MNDIEELVILATNNFTKIISTAEIKNNYKKLYWGGNGVGNRWANKKFNYSVIYPKKITQYSENIDDKIPKNILDEFLQKNNSIKSHSIIGIYVHSKKSSTQQHPICKNIKKIIQKMNCVVCGTTETICDHKNDLYNDINVLQTQTQKIIDFQPLCNHCNLQKRQINKREKETNKLYSAKNIQKYKIYPFEFPWEKKAFDVNDIYCKIGTFWYDPVEFENNIFCYLSFVVPIITEIKNKLRKGKLITIF